MGTNELNCLWHFSELQEATQDIGPNNAAAEYFKGTPYPSLIRESIQNSLDVASDPSKPVRMEFTFRVLRTGSFDNFFKLREHIEGVLNYYGDKASDEYAPMIDIFDHLVNNQGVISYIKISDYNTKGMDYNPNDTDSPFYAFMRAIGVTVKSDAGSGGSYGFGKSAYFAMSPIHTVLVSTRTTEGKTFFEGASTLCTHKMIGEDGIMHKYAHYGYYDNHSGQKPASGVEIPKRFQREEAGSDIMIMGVDGCDSAKETACEEMIKATLKNFWMSIFEHKLEVSIEGTEINADTVIDLMSNYFPDFIDRSKRPEDYNPRPYFEAVKNTNSSKLFPSFEAALPELGKVNLYLYKNKDLRDSVVYMRKQGMFIDRVRFYSKSYGYAAVFVCTDAHGNNLLKGIEDPSHTKWEAKRQKYGANVMKEISDFVSDCIQKAFTSNQNGVLGISGLEDYLFVPEDLIASNDDMKGNPLFGNPTGETIEDGIIPTSTIKGEPSVISSRDETLGNVVVHTPPTSATSSSDGSLGGHKRSTKKRKKRGSGSNPGKDRFTPSPMENEGEYMDNIPVEYRVIAEKKDGVLIHTLIIHSDYDVANGQIEIIVGGENNDEEVDIVRTSNGHPHGNIISGVTLKKDNKNLLEIQFSDNMKHVVKLTAYEFK